MMTVTASLHIHTDQHNHSPDHILIGAVGRYLHECETGFVLMHDFCHRIHLLFPEIEYLFNKYIQITFLTVKVNISLYY